MAEFPSALSAALEALTAGQDAARLERDARLDDPRLFVYFLLP